MLKIALSQAPQNEIRLPGLPAWLSRLLYARGIQTEAQARAFLHPGREQILAPDLLPDMEKARKILNQAKVQGKRVVIYGDYDVDGVCASAILMEGLTKAGLACEVYIPDRHKEGYGLNTPAVLALAKKCQVLVTVDCGITSVEEVKAAREAGMEVIVTDHHRHGEILPPAHAVISPLLGNYPFPYLCGAGVAWKLALAMIGEAAEPLMELAALATVADLVSLTGENRAIVALGLQKINETRRPGLRALMQEAGISKKITSETVAFQIAPRINACGRMESARIALDMLLTRDAKAAEMLAAKMERLNQLRKDQEAQVVNDAMAQVEKMDLVENQAIVVCGEGWNSGVVGLAAGKIVEKYAYPTVALARDGDTCVGSARSAGNVDIHAALCKCADLLIRFGGHKAAAGMTLAADQVEAFAKRLSDAVREQTGGKPQIPEMACDGELTLEQVSPETVEFLEMLEPFGMGNPAPKFYCGGVEPMSLRAVGSMGRHLKCSFRQNGFIRDGIFFGAGDRAGTPSGAFQLVMTPTLNEFRGRISAECHLEAMELMPESLPEEPVRELLSLLSDPMGKEAAEEIPAEKLDELMTLGQGTLLVCRCRETALALRKKYPQADFQLGKTCDPRVYHTILLYGAAKATCAGFRHVVLCDGNLGEKSAYEAACPGAQIWALPFSRALKARLGEAFVDKEGLRNCYRSLRGKIPQDLYDWEAQSGLSRLQGAFALAVLGQIGLIRFTPSPFSAALLPMVRRGPEESSLFRLAQQVKEEKNVVFSL